MTVARSGVLLLALSETLISLSLLYGTLAVLTFRGRDMYFVLTISPKF